MTWTRLDDGFTDRSDVAQLSLAARWHLLALVQWCSRTRRYDGTLREGDARRCSDVSDPAAALAELGAAGLVTRDVTLDGTVTVTVTGIEDHVPPPHLREDQRKASQRARKRRERDRKGTASPSDTSSTDDALHAVSGEVTRDTGTGQDRTGQDATHSTTTVITHHHDALHDVDRWRCPACDEWTDMELMPSGLCWDCEAATPTGFTS